jgi:hypothetical protein
LPITICEACAISDFSRARERSLLEPRKIRVILSPVSIVMLAPNDSCRASHCLFFSAENVAVVGAVGSFPPAAIRTPRVLLPHSVELRLLLVAQ